MYPNVLIISNNALSRSNCNGKTLDSFFEDWDTHKLAQLYFLTEEPDSQICTNYFRVTDVDVLKGRPGHVPVNLDTKDTPPSKHIQKDDRVLKWMQRVERFHLVRLMRELIWSLRWKPSDDLRTWLSEFSPEILFFMAGDSVFAYKIALAIREMYPVKLVLFITDDYVLPRFSLSLFYWIRWTHIRKYFRRTLAVQDLFLTISKSMRQIYLDLFGYDSVPFSQIAPSHLRDNGSASASVNFPVRMIYAGSFSFHRDRMLSQVADCCARINEKEGRELLHLDIYSASQTKMNLNGTASKFHGFLSAQRLEEELKICDILVFVESFDYVSRKGTRLSLSTKVTEYLSYGKCIFVFGPAEVSSVMYLSQYALCCMENNTDVLCRVLEQAVMGKTREQYAHKAREHYISHCSPDVIRDEFHRLLMQTRIHG